VRATGVVVDSPTVSSRAAKLARTPHWKLHLRKQKKGPEQPAERRSGFGGKWRAHLKVLKRTGALKGKRGRDVFAGQGRAYALLEPEELEHLEEKSVGCHCVRLPQEVHQRGGFSNDVE
jgi:hypothetical protein